MLSTADRPRETPAKCVGTRGGAPPLKDPPEAQVCAVLLSQRGT